MGKLKKWKKAERKKAELERWRKTVAPQPVGAFDRELKKGGATKGDDYARDGFSRPAANPMNQGPSEAVPQTIEQPSGIPRDLSDAIDELRRINRETLASCAHIGAFGDEVAPANDSTEFYAAVRFENSLKKLRESAPAMERQRRVGDAESLGLLIRKRGLPVPTPGPAFAPAQRLPGFGGVLPVPDSTHSMLNPEVRAEIKAIENDAKTKGWTDQDLWGPQVPGDTPRGLANLLRPGDTIVEVGKDYITANSPQFDFFGSRDPEIPSREIARRRYAPKIGAAAWSCAVWLRRP